MQAERLIKKCAICGQTENYIEIISNYIHGAPDLDLRQRGSMASPGSEIQMCPHCGYCNYDIEEHIQSRFGYVDDALDLWKKYDEVQEVINSDLNETLKKYLIMAEQYKGDLNHKKAYDMLIKASWAAESKEKDLEIKKEAIQIFLDEILPEIRAKLFQFADICRQCDYFEPALEIIKAGEFLIDEDFEDAKTLKKVAKFETKLIKQEDNNTHNMSEIE